MRILLVALLFLGLYGQGKAQETPVTTVADTTAPTTTDLLNELVDSTEQQPLLPHKMIFTQRVFWGPKGLLRSTNLMPLTPESRAHELKIRRTMLVSHQVTGFVTLAGFVAQGLVGAKLYNATGDQYTQLLNTHNRLATGINIAYTTTALLSLVAPPKMLSERKGISSIKLHKYLAVVHLVSMIATNVLAGFVSEQPQLKPYHRATAYTAFGAFALSIIAIKI